MRVDDTMTHDSAQDAWDIATRAWEAAVARRTDLLRAKRLIDDMCDMAEDESSGLQPADRFAIGAIYTAGAWMALDTAIRAVEASTPELERTMAAAQAALGAE